MKIANHLLLLSLSFPATMIGCTKSEKPLERLKAKVIMVETQDLRASPAAGSAAR